MIFKSYNSNKTIISFELFPPRTTKGIETLKDRLPHLANLNPDFITVTYGAMGTTQANTLEIAAYIKTVLNIDVAHHLTCVGTTHQSINTILATMLEYDINNIVALRGDPPEGTQTSTVTSSDFNYAKDLVEHIKQSDKFSVAVAGYPEKHVEAISMTSDIQNLKRKVDAGADAIITQLFYDNSDYFNFVDICRASGIDIPIIPGLMPILDVHQIQRITSMCGAQIPDRLLQNLIKTEGNPAATHRLGIDHTINQAAELKTRGVPGIHFYVLNQYFHIAEIMAEIT
jgi:methylenetetrahydrofolate reductase (NADPH)